MSGTTSAPQALLIAFRRAVLGEIRKNLEIERHQSEQRRARIIPLVREAVRAARDLGLCERVWLFGSYAWGQPGANSDVDLLVEGDDSEVAYRVAVACELEIHALSWDSAPEELRTRCQVEGVLL